LAQLLACWWLLLLVLLLLVPLLLLLYDSFHMLCTSVFLGSCGGVHNLCLGRAKIPSRGEVLCLLLLVLVLLRSDLPLVS